MSRSPMADSTSPSALPFLSCLLPLYRAGLLLGKDVAGSILASCRDVILNRHVLFSVPLPLTDVIPESVSLLNTCQNSSHLCSTPVRRERQMFHENIRI